MKLWLFTYTGDFSQVALSINSTDQRLVAGLMSLHPHQPEPAPGGGWIGKTTAVFRITDEHHAELVAEHGITLTGGADGVRFSLDADGKSA